METFARCGVWLAFCAVAGVASAQVVVDETRDYRCESRDETVLSSFDLQCRVRDGQFVEDDCSSCSSGEGVLIDLGATPGAILTTIEVGSPN